MNKIQIFSLGLMLFLGLSAQAQTADTTIQFKVHGVCGQCKQRIQKSMNIKGVRSSNWDMSTQMLTVSYDPSRITVDRLHKLVADVGHDTEKMKADDKVYEALDECCHYREMVDESLMAADDTVNMFRGIVVDDNNGQTIPLAGASLQWVGTSKGSVSNAHGEFMLPRNDGSQLLVVSYAGFKTDTVSVGDMSDVQITLRKKESLGAIIITARKKTSYIDNYNPLRVAIMTKKELLKAACCNLSESFETNPSVDVSYNDAATGSKQIQLLGLSGIYTQLTVENLPGPRGIATALGLNSIAGPWVESIQLIKGTGSVVNGYESIAGQINVELRKPLESEKLYLNGYINTMAKTDFNLNWSHKINSKWATGLLLHDDFLYTKQDANNDGFRDLPLGNQFSGVHRWQYLGDNGLVAHFGVKALIDDKTGGELEFDPSTDKFSTDVYGLGIKTKRYEAFGKIGYVFPDKMHKSLGLQLSAFDHNHDSYFGMNRFDARQKNFYSNFIYQSRIGSDAHQLKAGMSFQQDNYQEVLNGINYNRKEIVPGVFSEYTFSAGEKLDIVTGIRLDHNNLYGWFATPRLNVRYAPVNNSTFRFSIGRGQRTASIFAENLGVMVSSREINILNYQDGKPYGLDAEVSWNKGISYDQRLKLFDREASIGIDFYRNDFTNQVVMDIEEAGKVKFYNLEGKSFSNSLQAEVNFIPLKNFEVRMAYRYFDVKTNYSGKLLEKPFTSKHRAFTNLAYAINGWSMDYTFNWVGRKRIPSTAGNPLNYQLKSSSPSYVTMNAQVSKTLGRKKSFDLYLGGENLTNFLQNRSIIAADDPFSQWFDASMVWGPVSGRLVYAGFRYRLK